MPLTPTHALPYPLPSDPANVPADMQLLAEATDRELEELVTSGSLTQSQLNNLIASKGQPNGIASLGANGKVPAAQLGPQLPTTANEGEIVTWRAAGGGWVAEVRPAPAIPLSIVDAKGDVIVATANDTPARLPVGTDGQVLTADAASASGLKWGAVPPSGIPPAILDAKGDLIVASAPDTAARLGIGADGLALVADSASPLGLKWATVSGGGGGGGIPPEILDAKGDLIVAAAADTPARLAVGPNGQILIADTASPAGVKWGPAPAGIDYEGPWAAGTAYTPGDVVNHNGVEYLAVNPSTGQEPPEASGGGGAVAVSVRVIRAAVLAIGAGTTVVIPFDTEQFDAENMWLAGTPTRLTVPSGGSGIWLVGAHSAFTATAAGDMTGFLRKNGSTIAVGASNSTGTANVSNTNVQTVIDAVAGDYFEFVIQNVSAAGRNTSTTVPPTIYAVKLA